VTYTYMVSMHDDGTIGYTAPGQNNQFDYGWNTRRQPTSEEHAPRVDRSCRGAFRERVVLYGSAAGSRRRSPTVYGKPGTNRLNLTAAGAPPTPS
jgi:hypothetical protein